MKPLLISIAKALLQLALGKGVRKVLPLVYNRLDAEVPLLLYKNASPNKVRGAVASAISDTTGNRATTSQIEAVLSLYDPVKAAVTRFRH